MKEILNQIPKRIDEIFSQSDETINRVSNRLRWFFVTMFTIATLWSVDDSESRFIYLAIAFFWFVAALIFGLRVKTKLPISSALSMWFDLAIISGGLLLCALEGVLNGKGFIVFLCYFPVLALLAKRNQPLLIVKAMSFIILFYALISLFFIQSLAVPRLLAVVAMGFAAYSLTKQPKIELTTVAQTAVEKAYQMGASDREAQLTATIHAQMFPPPQYDMPGLYAAYKHGVGINTSGDFYAAIETEKGPMIVVGDLPGKGLESAMAASQLQQAITKLVGEKASLSEVAAELNSRMNDQRRQFGCLLARWEGSNLQYLNAGHLPAIHISKREPELLTGINPAIGASTESEFVEQVIPFAKGDLLLMYTDGAYSGFTNDRTAGAAEILRLVTQFGSGEVNTICHRVFDCGLPEYRKPEDDSTVVIVRRQEYAGEASAG